MYVHFLPVKGHVYTLARPGNSALPMASWTCTQYYLTFAIRFCSYVNFLTAVCFQSIVILYIGWVFMHMVGKWCIG